MVEKSGSSSWHKVFWMLRTPNQEFVGSKAYSINYGVMRNVKSETWSKAFNDPEWIRNEFSTLLNYYIRVELG